MQSSAAEIVLWILPILAAIVLHEVAHGFAAFRLGDDTAARAGRLTLNPIAHVDPIGTVIVPVFLLLTSSPFLFGWAKPVPVNYAALGNPRRDMVLVAAAGPMTNLVLATGCAMLFHAAASVAIGQDGSRHAVFYPLALMAQYGVLMNVFLGVFNLLPIPPLDGGRVMTGLLPLEAARVFARIEPFGFLVLIGLIATGALGLFLGPPVTAILGVLLRP